ncbi:MAG TPA: MtsA protein, partial [Myxococcaceae bacterium]|nr:MtsA protein [Myxococcaceae bacterium]
ITVYASAFAPLPNPFVGTDGAPVQELELPDGARGRPREGLKLFEARCAACHPPPHFSLDQDPATRGRHLDVGTPRGLPLRIELQDLFFKGVGTPSLLGAWDVFPMLTSGAAGFGVEGNARLKVSSRFPLREVLERYSGPAHGNAQALSPDQRNDLLAYVMSL